MKTYNLLAISTIFALLGCGSLNDSFHNRQESLKGKTRPLFTTGGEGASQELRKISLSRPLPTTEDKHDSLQEEKTEKLVVDKKKQRLSEVSDHLARRVAENRSPGGSLDGDPFAEESAFRARREDIEYLKKRIEQKDEDISIIITSIVNGFIPGPVCKTWISEEDIVDLLKFAVQKLGSDILGEIDVESGNIPLMAAVNWGWNSVIEFIIKNFPKEKKSSFINARDNNGCTALHLAAGNGYLNVVKVLLEAGANIDAVDINGRTPLYYAIQRYYDCTIHGYYATQEYRSNTQLDLIRYLIDNRADIFLQDREDGNTILHLAIYRGLGAVVTLILENVPQDKLFDFFKLKNVRDQTVLHVALLKDVRKKSPNIISLLIEKLKILTPEQISEIINIRSISGKTPLFYLVSESTSDDQVDFVNVIQYFLFNGADISVQDEKRNTPLHWATKRRLRNVVEFLIKNGANVNAENYKKRTPVAYADEEMKKFIAALLVVQEDKTTVTVSSERK